METRWGERPGHRRGYVLLRLFTAFVSP